MSRATERTERLAFGCALAVALAGCDAFGGPDRFVNESARPPTSGVLDITDLRPGQHVAGTVRLSLDLDSLAGRVVGVYAAVDGTEAGLVTGPPYVLTLETDRYPEGPRTLSVGVYLRDPSLGLLSLAGVPATVLSVPIKIDRRPPTPVTLTALGVGDDGRTRLEWTANTDANFHAYLVARYPEDAGSPSHSRALVDTVYDRAATSYTDCSLPAVIGARVGYEVRVWNRREESGAQRRMAMYGAAYPWSPASGGAPTATSADGSEYYTVAGSRLIAVSTTTHETTRALRFSESEGAVFGGPHGVQFDPASRLLHVATHDFHHDEWRLHAVDPATFAVRRTHRLPDGDGRFAAAGGRVYTVGFRDGLRLLALDAETGANVAEAASPFLSDEPRVVGASVDGRSVYVVDLDAGGQVVLGRFDVTGGSPRPVERYVIDDWTFWTWGAVAVVPDGRVLVHAGTTVTALDGSSLRPVGHVDLGGLTPLVHEQPLVLLAGGGRAYVVRRTGTSRYTALPEVVEVDLDDLREMRNWRFVEAPAGLALDGRGRLFAFASNATWVVPL